MLIFDTETNGFLDVTHTIHCLHMGDPETGEQWRYSSLPGADGTVEDGLRRLEEADEIGGHNVFRFDIAAIKKVYPWWNPKGYIWDTLALSCLVYPKDELKEIDNKLQRKNKLPAAFFAKNYFAGQQLGAWGFRLGVLKDEFSGDFSTLTQEMDDYCAQDVTVNTALWRKVWDKLVPPAPDREQWFRPVPCESALLENEVLRIIAGQEHRGFTFDVDKARELECTLFARKAELDSQLREAFAPWYARKGGPKQSNAVVAKTCRRKVECMGRTIIRHDEEGARYTKIALTLFNPASRAHIENRLRHLYGWEPTVFTDSGAAEISEETLDGMEFPEAPLLKEYLMVDKRLGLVSTGKQAWLLHVKEDGRIHGRVNTNQAITGRMTHSSPNVAQVPKVKKGKTKAILLGSAGGYGFESRSLFRAASGYVLIGCDAEGLELRCLGHFMARYDAGAYGNAVVNGNSADGTDVHTLNQKAIGLNSRDSAKTFAYALIYGSGDPNLGTIIVEDMPEDKRRKWHAQFKTEKARENGYRSLGLAARRRFMKNLPALGKLVDAVSEKVKKQGWIMGIDGRKLPIRKAHAALNTLLQSAGALVMKKALIIMEADFVARGWTIGDELAFVANIHDEVQIEAKKEISEDVANIAADAIRRAGEHFGFRCELAGNAATGVTWADTH